MYRRPKFLEVLLEIREKMAVEADYDVDLFAEMARSGSPSQSKPRRPGSPYSGLLTPEDKAAELVPTRDE